MEQIICGYVDNGNLLFADAMYRVPTFAVSEQLVEGLRPGFDGDWVPESGVGCMRNEPAAMLIARLQGQQMPT